MQKSYTVKIYRLDGTYVKTQNPLKVTSEVRLTTKLNGVQGQCVIELALPIDDFDEGNSIKLMNVAKIYEADDENSPAPRLIYTGYISQYAPFFSESTQGVRLTLLGIGSLLTLAYFKNGGSFTVAKNADPAQIMSDIIDHFNSVYPGNWLSHGSSVQSVGTTVSYTFTDAKWLDALKKTFDLSGSGWWWKIAENGELYFKQKPGTATHIFSIGGTISSGEILKNSEQIINALQVRWGGGPTTVDFSDATSITNYGRHEKITTDSSIGDGTSANQNGSKDVTDNKDPKIQAKLRINTTYDIESVKVGDTCTVVNVNNRSTLFSQNMLITSVSYTPDYIDIELENNQSTFADNFTAAVQAVQ